MMCLVGYNCFIFVENAVLQAAVIVSVSGQTEHGYYWRAENCYLKWPSPFNQYISSNPDYV